MTAITPNRWDSDRLILLDQTVLPEREVERSYQSWQEVGAAIRTLVVRGAPAIGVAAAFGVALAARESRAATFDGLIADLETAIKGLAATRPTAVNLFWALDRMRRVAVGSSALPLDQLRARLLAGRRRCATRTSPRIAPWAPTAPRWCRARADLTHCNAGALATAGYGTALGVVRAAHEQGKVALVWVDETRPVMQGSRLTAWSVCAKGSAPADRRRGCGPVMARAARST
jgi:methylthioribose-1-phosphate isomerase